MIKIFTSEKFQPEKKYVFDILFRDAIGVDYSIHFHEHAFYLINCGSSQIKIRDDFFSRFEDGIGYGHEKNIPTSVFKSSVPWNDEDLIGLFGDESIEIKKNNASIGLDIFASTFFMLTRWEESVSPHKDLRNRFLAINSLAYKNDFLLRPIVNEYVLFLKELLENLGHLIAPPVADYQLVLTHDVDRAFKWGTWEDYFLHPLRKAKQKKKQPKNALKSFAKEISKGFNTEKHDTYNTFDFLMNESEKVGARSHFFLLVGRTNYRFDPKNRIHSNRYQQLLKSITDRGHRIGFHPSYETYKDEALFRKELDLLFTVAPNATKIGRQHYLRFSVPETWQIWDDCSMEWDSTLGYADYPGFRAGYCKAFNVFNWKKRTPLKLKELPLLGMDVTPNHSHKLSYELFFNHLKEISDQVKKHQGTFVLLWHNSFLVIDDNTKYFDYYQNLITEIS